MTLQARITTLANTVATDIKALRTGQGNLASLTTTEKTNLVGALNELRTAVLASASINDTTPSGTSTYSSNKIDSQISAAVSALIGGAPAALDTLNELAAALDDNASYASTVTTALGQRVAVTAQTFTAPEQAQARTNIGAASQADLDAFETAVGDTETDFSALYIATRDA